MLLSFRSYEKCKPIAKSPINKKKNPAVLSRSFACTDLQAGSLILHIAIMHDKSPITTKIKPGPPRDM